MGNNIAGRVLLAAIALGGTAGLYLSSRGSGPPPGRVLYLEHEGAPFREIYHQFERKLAAIRGASRPVRTQFVAVGDRPAEARARIEAQFKDPPLAVVATSGGAASLAQEISPSTPMVFFSNGDPVAQGLVADINRPGGNRTGITTALPTFEKRIEILHEAVPAARVIGVLVERADDEAEFPGVREASAHFGVAFRWVGVRSAEEATNAIAGREGRSIDAWYIPYNSASFLYPDAIVAALDRARRPAIFERAKFADMGGLLAYQHTVEDPAERFAEVLSSILDGVPPADIPVVRPRRFELVLNLAAARRLGLDMPKSLVKSADRVIAE